MSDEMRELAEGHAAIAAGRHVYKVLGNLGNGTAARTTGNCVNCGAMRYEGLVHHCSTGAIVQHHLGSAPQVDEEKWEQNTESLAPPPIGGLTDLRKQALADDFLTVRQALIYGGMKPTVARASDMRSHEAFEALERIERALLS